MWKLPKLIWILLAAHFIARATFALLTELGVDEVYYVSYALQPDWSHFDHPPLVGFLIQLTTLNVILLDDFFVRLGPLIIGSINLVIVYKIGHRLHSELAGKIAALLFSASIYASILTGLFILPDTPQSIFWLGSLYFLTRILNGEVGEFKLWISAGICMGLAFLSKYHGVFLGAGFLLFVTLVRRDLLRNPWMLLSVTIAVLLTLPVLYWNVANEFASLSFHGNRVSLFGRIRLDYLGQEIGGQFLYQNPIVYVWCIIALIGIVRKRIRLTDPIKLILFIGLPLVIVFTGFSLFRRTLPHWSGPAFYGFMLIAAVYMAERIGRIHATVWIANGFIALLMIAAVLQINSGVLIQPKSNAREHRLGRKDPTLDMYGWEQLRRKFEVYHHEQLDSGKVKHDAPIFTNKWFPGGHLDFYVALPTKRFLFAAGPIHKTHKYHWLNAYRGGVLKDESGYYITSSRYFEPPPEPLLKQFKHAHPRVVIPIERGGQTVKNIFIYRLDSAITMFDMEQITLWYYQN